MKLTFTQSDEAQRNPISKPEKTGLDVQYFQLKNFNHLKEESFPWDFSYTPKIIVINLGQNEPSEPSTDFIASYLVLVKKLRKQFPNTEIMAMVPSAEITRAMSRMR